MLIDVVPLNHDHVGQMIIDDADGYAYCRGCGTVWRLALMHTDIFDGEETWAYQPVGRIVDDVEPF